MFQSLFKYMIATIFLLLFTLTALAQSFESELKKDLLKTIKPDKESKKATPDSLQNRTSRHVNPMITLDEKYQLNEPRKKLSFNDINPENKRVTPADTVSFKFDMKSLNMSYYNHFTTVYDGNHFVTAPFHAGFILNISGGGRKKLSKKTRRILREVYGVSEEQLGK
jgi:hypothetical protein